MPWGVENSSVTWFVAPSARLLYIMTLHIAPESDIARRWHA